MKKVKSRLARTKLGYIQERNVAMQSMQGNVVKAYVKDTAHLSPSDHVFTVNIDNTSSNLWDHTDSKTSLKFSLLKFHLL